MAFRKLANSINIDFDIFTSLSIWTMKKLKLKPSARDNRRYLLINEKNNEKIEKAILDYVGILGFAKSGYMKVKSAGDKTIGAVVRESLNEVVAGLGFVGISVGRVSGTLKGLGKK